MIATVQTFIPTFSRDISAARVQGGADSASTLSSGDSHSVEDSENARRTDQKSAVPSNDALRDALSPEEDAQVVQLEQRDREVRNHEAAHISAGGAYVRGGATYSYTAGPDGKRYAVGGEVSIDVSPVANNPEATVAKMQTVRQAALAPAQPSGQDLSVAAQAAQIEIMAREEASAASRAERGEELQGVADTDEKVVGEGELGNSPAPTVAMTAAQLSDPTSIGARLDAYA